MLEFNNYKSVRVIIYTNFVVQTVKNSNPLEVFGDMIFLSGILNTLYIKEKQNEAGTSLSTLKMDSYHQIGRHTTHKF